MQIVNPLTHKSISEVQPGELIVTSFGSGFALAIYLRRLEQSRSLFAIIGGPEFGTPEVYATEHTGNCLSYGQEWVLEVVPGEETFPQNHYRPDERASLFLDNATVVLSLKFAEFQRERRVNFDLNTMADHQLSPYAAPVFAWRVWQSDFERQKSGARPIFEITGDLNANSSS